MALDAVADVALRRKLDHPPRLPASERLAVLAQAVRSLGGRLPLQRMLAPLRGTGRLTVDEALYFGLYRDGIAEAEARRFVGKRRQAKFHHHCNDSTWFAAAHDKALFYTVVKGTGLRTPTTRAVWAERHRGGYPRFLRTKADLAAFLLQNREWPLFLKPIDGMYSIGSLKVMGAADGQVELFGGEKFPVATVADYMAAMSETGYLLQDCLAPSSFAREAFGAGVPSVRLLILFSAAEPVIESAVIKIPSADHIADNYWRRGNMLGALSHETGTIDRVISGFGSTLVEHERHPVTGTRLVGLSIPDIRAVCDIALTAASIFPGIRTQSWDVALTGEGPALLEFNFGGDLNLHQLAHHRGALTDRFIEHLRRCGYRGKLI